MFKTIYVGHGGMHKPINTTRLIFLVCREASKWALISMTSGEFGIILCAMQTVSAQFDVILFRKNQGKFYYCITSEVN